jgi:two-component system, LuxR family, response regulator FixJ
MNKKAGVVHVVDDDEGMSASLAYLFDAHQIASKCYRSSEEFLAVAEPAPGCLLVDLWMPGIGGLALLDRLAAEDRLPPTIVLTAHGDVEAAVRSMKLGAVEFLAKPHDSRVLLEAVRAALAQGVALAELQSHRRRLAQAVKTLTPREQQVVRGVIAGKSSRQIAEGLGLQPKSVEIYRGRVLEKLGFSTTLEMVGTIIRVMPELGVESAS